MIDIILKEIEETVSLIKSKNDNSSSFSKKSLYKFELRFFLCMSIVRAELQFDNKISDQTASALSPLFGFNCFEFYYRDYPEVYEACIKLYLNFLRKCNESLEKDELRQNLGTDGKKWIRYYNKVIASLI